MGRDPFAPDFPSDDLIRNQANLATMIASAIEGMAGEDDESPLYVGEHDWVAVCDGCLISGCASGALPAPVRYYSTW